MFVHRKANRNKPGRTDLQTYIPHKQALMNTMPQPIRSRKDAKYYYDQLVNHGYIPDILNNPPAPLPSINNILISTLTYSEGTYLEFDVQTGQVHFAGADLEEGALDPMPDPNTNYIINISSIIVARIETLSGLTQLCTNAIPMVLEYDTTTFPAATDPIASKTLTNAKVAGFVTVSGTKELLVTTSGEGLYYFRFDAQDTWRINLSPAQTLITLRFTPVNE